MTELLAAEPKATPIWIAPTSKAKKQPIPKKISTRNIIPKKIIRIYATFA